MSDKVNNVFLAIAVIIGLIGIVIALRYSTIENDKADCYKWQEWAKEYPGFYLTKNEVKQCEYFGIQVEAPVR